MGYRLRAVDGLANANAVMRVGDAWQGMSEPRSTGAAVGYGGKRVTVLDRVRVRPARVAGLYAHEDADTARAHRTRHGRCDRVARATSDVPVPLAVSALPRPAPDPSGEW